METKLGSSDSIMVKLINENEPFRLGKRTKLEQLQPVKQKLGWPLQAAHKVQHFKHFTGNTTHAHTCTLTLPSAFAYPGGWAFGHAYSTQRAQRTEVTPFQQPYPKLELLLLLVLLLQA